MYAISTPIKYEEGAENAVTGGFMDSKVRRPKIGIDSELGRSFIAHLRRYSPLIFIVYNFS